MTIRINSRALWFSALRGLGWGFLRFEVLFLAVGAVISAKGSPLGDTVALVAGVPLFAAALVLPIHVIVMSAIRATRPPSVWWARTMLVCAVLTPVLVVAALQWPGFWATTPGYAYLWSVPVVSMAASGFALLPLRRSCPGGDEADVVLPLWRIPLAVLAGLALGGFVYAALYYGWLVRPLGEVSGLLLMIPQLFLASTVGCYAVALMWRLSGKQEGETEVSP